MARGGGPRAAVEVEGGPRCRRAFRNLGATAADLKDAHRSAGRIVRERADSLVPRLSGELAATSDLEVRTRGVAVTYGGTVPYAGPIHYGWRDRNIEPQPWLTDALADTRTQVAAAYAVAIDGLVRRFDVEAPD